MTRISNSHSIWSEIARHINATEGEDQVIRSVTSVSGGDISQAFRLECSRKTYFVKLNTKGKLPMFEAESLALEQMANFCPAAICADVAEDYAFIVLEFLPLTSGGAEKRLAELIAKLHGVTQYEGLFGWSDNNFIGSTPQRNDWNSHWNKFWWEMRIHPQLSLAYDKGYGKKLSLLEHPLKAAIDATLHSHLPEASLLHGDLWSGNKAFLTTGEPIIFDPATYYGDAETDIAMTELFGGFGPEFYRRYYQIRPKRDGYEKRKVIYNLYHILNHLNLFGSGYLSQSLNMIRQIVDR